MYEPAVTGFADEFSDPSKLLIEPWPLPDESALKIAGAVALTGFESGLDITPR